MSTIELWEQDGPLERRGRITIKELADKTVTAMVAHGLESITAWNFYGNSIIPLIRAHETKGKDEFDRDIVTAYVQSVEGRVERGEIKHSHYKGLLNRLH